MEAFVVGVATGFLFAAFGVVLGLVLGLLRRAAD